MNTTNIKYGSIVPLLGGMVLGHKKFYNKNPEIIYSYKEFNENDKNLLNYLDYKNYLYVDDFKEKIDLDFVSTVCPCAGLTTLNHSKDPNKFGGYAEQNEWMYKTANFVLNKIKPNVFFGENSSNLVSINGYPVLYKLFKIGKNYGYNLSVFKSSLQEHGIPQTRTRAFYFFWKNKIPYLNWIKRPLVPYLEIISNIDKNSLYQEEYGNKYEENPEFEIIKEFNIDINELTKFGKIFNYFFYKNIQDKLKEFLESNKDKNRYYSLYYRKIDFVFDKIKNKQGFWDFQLLFPEEARVLPSINGKVMGKIFNIKENRLFTLREYMRLMGLPDDFNLVNKKNARHITQNVHVDVAYDITQNVDSYLNDKLPFYELVEDGILIQFNSSQNFRFLNYKKLKEYK
jgi:site-specific DNA-cytosine methylase